LLQSQWKKPLYQNKFTSKLFYKKYAYRLGIRCHLASIFRNKDFNYAKYRLDLWNQDIAKGIVPTFGIYGTGNAIQMSDIHLALRLLNIFTTANTEFTLRIESKTINVFSNDTVWLDSLKNKLHYHIVDFMEPKNTDMASYLLENPNIEIVKNNEYEYKLKTRYVRQSFKPFAEWCQKFPKHVKISNIFLKELMTDSFLSEGRIIHVKDKKTLNIVTLFIGEGIQSVTRLVTSDDLDI